MAGRILRACSRCARALPPDELVRGRCPTCRSIPNVDASPTTRTRPSSSTERERLRRIVLERDPECQLRLPGCTGKSEVMDHVIPAAMGGTYDLSNLQGSCALCNGSKGGRLSQGTYEGRQRKVR